MRATRQLIQMHRPASGRVILAVSMTVLWWGTGHSSVSGQSLVTNQSAVVSALQLKSAVLGQLKKTKPVQKKKEDGPKVMPELLRDKIALPLGYRVPPVQLPELTITRELDIPKKEDKAAWAAHNSKMSKYGSVLIKGNFGDEKAEREILRYGITYRLHKMTHRSLLYPSDEDRTKVVEAEKKPEPPETLITIREQLISDLRKTSSAVEQFQIRDAFLDIFVEEAPKLLDNNTYVRFQIGYLLATFNNRDADPDRNRPEEPCFKAIKVLINMVNDDKILYWSKVAPVRGLARCCRHKNCKTDDRFVIMETLIKQLGAAKTLHSWYGETVAESLCQVGDPLDRAKNPAIAEALLAVIKDKAYPDRVRVRAAHSIARIPLETFKRTDEVAIEILRLGDDLAQAYEKDPKRPIWREDFLMLYLAFQPENQGEKKELKGLKNQVENKGVLSSTRTVVDEAYQHLLPLVQNVIGVKGVTPIPDQLRKIKTWLDVHPANKNVAANPMGGA